MMSAFATSYAVSPEEVLGKAVAKIKRAGNVDCRFSVSGPDGSINGQIIASGNKFKLTTPMGSSWFDGTNMWTSNPKTKEITLVNPTDAEVKESNPFSYLEGYRSDYRLFFSKRKDASRYLVLLNPKSSKSGIKAVEIAINKKTFLPERFIIRDKNDKVSTVGIQSLSLKSGDTASFVCPVSGMSDYELIDLR